MKSVKALAAACAALCLTAPALSAEGEQRAPEHHHWHHAGPFGTFDRSAVQRGFQVYQEVCASCHGMDLLSFRNLGEVGGPFRYGPSGELDDYGNPEVIEYTDPNANPIIRAIAAQYIVVDTEEFDEYGDPIERAGEPKDRFPSPYANNAQAAAANNNAIPPDLSVITKARHHGEDYIRSLMLGYDEEPPADVEVGSGQYYNPYFPGGVLAMGPQLLEGRVEYADGTEATPEQILTDASAGRG